MDHLPINHQLRPFWRALAFLCGAYMLAFGVVGFLAASDAGLTWFAQDDLPVALGLRANPAFSLLSIIVGAIVLLAVVVGRNVDRYVNFTASTVLLLAGMAMLAFLRTDLNYFGFTMTTCVVSFILGLVLLTAGLYGRVGSKEAEAAESERRHRVIGDNTGVVGDA